MFPENIRKKTVSRRNRFEQKEKCRNWTRYGSCSYGKVCRYKHEPFSPQRAPKPEKDMAEKDLRHRVRTKRDEPKGSITGSLSPKRTGKRSSSRSTKGEHESKIKSTAVAKRLRSPAAPTSEPAEPKEKGEGNWEDDSDDWSMDASPLDFNEELTLEQKRQQLQRELALELQKERFLNENDTITNTEEDMQILFEKVTPSTSHKRSYVEDRSILPCKRPHLDSKMITLQESIFSELKSVNENLKKQMEVMTALTNAVKKNTDSSNSNTMNFIKTINNVGGLIFASLDHLFKK